LAAEKDGNEYLEEELAMRNKQVADLQGQIEVSRKVLNDKRAENEELRKQLAKWQPKRGKGGRFIKN
jgi:septal ring factor EnvC (AmiA/AmiB activator)